MTEPTAQQQTPTSHPRDPAMAATDPDMFSSLTRRENSILWAHLASGWFKQSDVYPALSEPWRETGALIDDVTAAWLASLDAGQALEAEAGS